MRFLNRRTRILFAGFALILCAVVPLSAATYQATLSLTENGTAAYTKVAVNVPANVSSWVSGGYISSTGLDVKLKKGTTEVPLMLANDKFLFVDGITQGGTNSYILSTGNTPATSMPIITGHGGYVTVSDAAALELGNNFKIDVSGYVDTSAGADKNILRKDDAIQIYVSGDEEITVYIDGVDQYVSQAQTDTTTMGDWNVNAAAFTTPASPATFTFTHIGVKVKRDPNNDDTGNTTVALVTDVAGDPDVYANAISFGSYNVNDLPVTLTELNLDMDDVVLNANTKYWLVFWNANHVSGKTWRTFACIAAGDNFRSTLNDTDYTDGVAWIPNARTIWLKVYGAYNWELLADNVASGNRQIELGLVGATLVLEVDGVEKDTASFASGTVADNANNYILGENEVMPYMDYFKMTIGGVLTVWYQPNTIISGTTLPDRQGTAQNGTITWGSNPAGLSAGLLSFHSTGVVIPGVADGQDTQGILSGGGGITDNTSETSGQNDVDAIMSIFGNAMDLDLSLMWWGAYVLCTVVAIVWVAGKTNHLFLGLGAAAIVAAAFCFGFNTIPDVMVYLMVAITIGFTLLEARQTT